MSHLSPRQGGPRAEPVITVLPHISAPIDQGPLFPKPPRALHDRLLVAGLVAVLTVAVLAFAFLHAAALR